MDVIDLLTEEDNRRIRQSAMLSNSKAGAIDFAVVETEKAIRKRFCEIFG